jgi:hypothetical protein
MSENIDETGDINVSEEPTETENEISALFDAAVEKEQRAHRRLFYWTIIPAALALILLMGTGIQMRTASRAVSDVRIELAVSEDKILDLRLELDNAQEDLNLAHQETLAAQETLTKTLVTLENVTGDLVSTRDQLAQIQGDYEDLKAENTGLQDQVKGYTREIADLKRQIEELEQALESQIDTDAFRYLGEWQLEVPILAARYPEAGPLLQTVNELQDIKWRAGGFSPDTGFDSTGFAAYVLLVNGRLGEESFEKRDQLMEVLPARQGGPVPGDLVFYEGGAAMFYCIDAQGVPFVVGMTSRGVIALQLEFAPILGYGITAP